MNLDCCKALIDECGMLGKKFYDPEFNLSDFKKSL